MTGDIEKQKYISYCMAMEELKARLNATPEELAIWMRWHPPQNGGLVGFTNIYEFDDPPFFRFQCIDDKTGTDYLSCLESVYFIKDNIDNFQPTERYIKAEALMERWRALPGGKPEAKIAAKIGESRLHATHPITGLTGWDGGDGLAPKESALFPESEILEIERRDFRKSEPSSTVAPAVAMENTRPAGLSVTTNKLRRNSLDPAIDKAIKEAGNMELADVFLKLKELALNEEPPFAGTVTADTLHYTNDKDELATLSKEQLRKRLDTRKRNAA